MPGWPKGATGAYEASACCTVPNVGSDKTRANCGVNGVAIAAFGSPITHTNEVAYDTSAFQGHDIGIEAYK